jgi:hypothetical protein
VEDFGHDFLRKVSNIPSIAKGEFVWCQQISQLLSPRPQFTLGKIWLKNLSILTNYIIKYVKGIAPNKGLF